ncbi:MAG: nucleotidyltransferase domain-containing protein [Dehalococcoidales bacterium]
MLETLFGSKLRAKILGRLFTRSGERYFVRQLAATIGEDSTNVSRELARLEQAGLLVSITEGRQKYYQADPKSPLFKDIRGLMSHLPAAQPDSNALLRRRLKINQPELTGFCRLNHVQKLSLYGSVLRADFKPESDIDVLVEFQLGKTPGFLKMAGMEEELSNMIGGRKVDLRTPQDLSLQFRGRVMAEAKVLCP